MSFIETLHQKLDVYHLLSHPFYQTWNAGKLSVDTLKTYAKEYYHHVAAFPRYVSGIHTNCSDISMRQILLGNLIDEEQGNENHPELWKQFAEGLGVTRDEFEAKPQLKETSALVDGYFDHVRSDFATGLGALYAYERQTPEVSVSKIEGLCNYYGIEDERTLKFFAVHADADIWHREECAKLIESLSEDEQQKVLEGAEAGAKLLWGFLDGMMEVHGSHACAA
ncbi:MAG: CADD family putative folate metabolism protein [Pseudomonadota bacterium]